MATAALPFNLYEIKVRVSGLVQPEAIKVKAANALAAINKVAARQTPNNHEYIARQIEEAG